MLDMEDKPENMVPLFETILDYIPAPEGDPDAGTQVLIRLSTTTSMWAVSASARWKTVP